MGAPRKNPQERFDARWLENKETGCWDWQGPWGKSGYGTIWGGPTLGAVGNIAAHRVSWLLHCGPIPDAYLVCHRCDNPRCVNPSHLFLGSAQDNTLDMLRKERSPKGEKSWRAKITEADVAVIRDRRNKVKDLCECYGLSVAGVEAVRYRKTWKHLP